MNDNIYEAYQTEETVHKMAACSTFGMQDVCSTETSADGLHLL